MTDNILQETATLCKLELLEIPEMWQWIDSGLQFTITAPLNHLVDTALRCDDLSEILLRPLFSEELE